MPRPTETSRSVPEWIGAHPDAKVPPHVRARIFDAHGGRCGLTGRKIRPGDAWELDHKRALALGGEHRETNLRPVLSLAHKAKTATDVGTLAKDRRVRAKHIGAAPKSRRPLPGGRHDRMKHKVGGGWVPRFEE